MRTVRFTWRVLVQQLSLLPADGEVEGFGCIRERVDNVLYSFLRVGEKGEVIDIVLHVTHTTHTQTKDQMDSLSGNFSVLAPGEAVAKL